jgi:hypothetical protein
MILDLLATFLLGAGQVWKVERSLYGTFSYICVVLLGTPYALGATHTYRVCVAALPYLPPVTA